jgi:hypothetical protein
MSKVNDSNYQQEHKAAKDELQQENESARQAQVLYEFMRAHPEIIPCEANLHLLKAWFGNLPEDISKATLGESIQHPKLRAQLAFQGEAQEREKLVDYIIENRQMSPDTSKHERARLLNQKLTTIETVRTIAENIQRKRELSQLPKKELQALARGPERQKFQEVPPLYQNRSMLYDLANTDLDGFKSLLRRCGKAQIDAILQQSEADQ